MEGLCLNCQKNIERCGCPKKNHESMLKKIQKDFEIISNEISYHINLLKNSQTLYFNQLPPIDITKVFFLSFEEFSSDFEPKIYTKIDKSIKILDISTQKETIQPIEITETLYSSICYSETHLFIVGGDHQFSPINQIQCINKKNFQCENILNLNQQRNFSASLVANKKLFVVGGKASNESEEVGLNSVEVFDLENIRNPETLLMNHGFSRPCVTLINDQVFVTGFECIGFGYKIDVETLQISEIDLGWFGDQVYFISNYENQLLLIGQKIIGTQKRQKNIDIPFSQSWSQQGPVCFGRELHWFDYFTSKVVRLDLTFLN